MEKGHLAVAFTHTRAPAFASLQRKNIKDMTASQTAFPYTKDQLTTLTELISQARLLWYYGNVRTYTDDEDRLRKAITLYERNTMYSEVMYTVIQGCEVTRRNAIHNRLKADHATELWYEKLGLREIEQNSIAKAKKDLQEKAQAITPDRVVGELSFGFWVGLFSHGYEELLWTPSLVNLFPASTTRGSVYSRLKDMKMFRNRIAHHNRIIGRPQTLRETYNLFLGTIRELNETMHTWVAATNRADGVLPKPIFERPKPGPTALVVNTVAAKPEAATLPPAASTSGDNAQKNSGQK
jgi:hypothetical protein